MAKQRKFEYIEIEQLDGKSFLSVEIKDLEGFIKLAEAANAKFIFKTDSKDDISYFMLFLDKIIYKLKSNDYEALVDYEDALKNGFPTAADYYEAQKGSFHSYKEYNECLKSGITDKSIYQNAKRLGFVEHYDEFKEKAEKNKAMLPEKFNIADYDNAIKLYEYATSKGFVDYGIFQKVIFLGFSDNTLYLDAKSKGFTYAKDYLEAVKMGFDKIKEYQEAIYLKMTSKYEYDKYSELQKASKNMYGFDQVQLIQALKKYEDTRKLPLKKLKEILAQQQEEYKFVIGNDNTKIFPEWYSQKLTKDEFFIDFLSKTDELKDVGLFDAEGEYFEVFGKMSETKIYIDGSNVGYENFRQRDNPDADNKPRFSNIKLVVEELHTRRYKDIMVIADPGLNRKAVDNNILKQLIKDKQIKFYEAPSNTEADEFLIENAKKDSCYIITNDTFRDWKMKDVWIAEHIDKIRIPFMITDGKVTLSGLD